MFNHIEFELLALECGAPPGGRSPTGWKAAGAQRPTPCEAEGRASASISVSKIGGLRIIVAEDQQWGGPRSIIAEMQFSAINLSLRGRTA